MRLRHHLGWIDCAVLDFASPSPRGGASASGVGCRSRRGPESPLGDLPAGVRRESLNVLLVTLDTTRADRIGVYGRPLGGSPPETPVLDRLAGEGALFLQASSVTPLTLPAHSTIMTGLLPGAHGVRDNGGFRLADERKTLAEAFAAAGFRTGGFVSAYVLDHKWGIAQGFERYFDDFDLEKTKTLSLGEIQRPGDETIAEATKWIDSLAAAGWRRRRAVLRLGPPLRSAHAAHAAGALEEPLPGRGLQRRGRLDGQSRRQTSRPPRGTRTPATHGRHGGRRSRREPRRSRRSRARFLHLSADLLGAADRRRAVRRRPATRRIATPVGQQDLAPTLLELAGVAGGLEQGQGRSLVPAARGRGRPARQPAARLQRDLPAAASLWLVGAALAAPGSMALHRSAARRALRHRGRPGREPQPGRRGAPRRARTARRIGGARRHRPAAGDRQRAGRGGRGDDAGAGGAGLHRRPGPGHRQVVPGSARSQGPARRLRQDEPRPRPVARQGGDGGDHPAARGARRGSGGRRRLVHPRQRLLPAAATGSARRRTTARRSSAGPSTTGR